MTNAVDTSVQAPPSSVTDTAVQHGPEVVAESDTKAALSFLADAIKQGRFDGIQIDQPGPIDIYPRPPIGMPFHPPFMRPPLSGMIERLLVALTVNDVASHGKEIDTNHDGVVSLPEYTQWSGQDKGSSPLRTAAFAEVAQLNPGQDSEGQLGVRIEGIDTIMNRPPMVMKGEDGPMTRELRADAGEAPAGDAAAGTPADGSAAPESGTEDPAAGDADLIAKDPSVSEQVSSASDLGELMGKLLEALKGRKIDPRSEVGQLLTQLLLALIEDDVGQHGAEMDANTDGVLTLDEFSKFHGESQGLSSLMVAAFAEAVQQNPGADSAGQLGLSLEKKMIPMLGLRSAPESADSDEDVSDPAVDEEGAADEQDATDEAENPADDGSVVSDPGATDSVVQQPETDVGDLLPKLLEAISGSKLDPQSGLGQLVKQLLLTLTENDLAQHGTEMDANQDGVVTLPEFAKGKGDGKLSGLALDAFAEAVQRSPGADGAGQLGFHIPEVMSLIQPKITP